MPVIMGFLCLQVSQVFLDDIVASVDSSTVALMKSQVLLPNEFLEKTDSASRLTRSCSSVKLFANEGHVKTSWYFGWHSSSNHLQCTASKIFAFCRIINYHLLTYLKCKNEPCKSWDTSSVALVVVAAGYTCSYSSFRFFLE